MRRIGSALLAVSLLAGCGGSETPPPSESVEQQQAPLTETDVDVAPECQGIISFVNVASFATLDAYLPSDVATNLINQRTVSPFVTLADVASVRLVGDTRLEQIEAGARAQGFIFADCVGIEDQLALSADDAARMVSLVNSISDSELHAILPDAWNGAVNLLNTRPFTSVGAIAATANIGPASIRDIRNAATLSRPLEELIDAVNAVPVRHNGVSMARHFDWYRTMMDAAYAYQRGSVECFGIPAAYLPDGAVDRGYLADDAEVRAWFAGTVSFANRNGEIAQSTIDSGKANLEQHIAGRGPKFKGCYISYAPDPWSGHDLAFFVDIDNGFGVKGDTYWTE